MTRLPFFLIVLLLYGDLRLVMRVLALLLLPPLVAAVSANTYFVLQDGAFTDSASSVWTDTSLARCTARCGRLPEVQCDGVRYGADGRCELLAQNEHCLQMSDTPSAVHRSYRRHTARPAFCSAQWLAFNGSCYLRHSQKMTRGKAKGWCKSSQPLADVVSVSGAAEWAFMLHHPSRSSKREWLGWSNRHGVNPDGTAFTPPVPMETGGGCVALRENHTQALITMNCGERHRFICEQPRPRCLYGGCPSRWLQTPAFCYFFIGEPATFAEADQHCIMNHSARLAHPGQQGMAQLMAAYVSESGQADSFWVGVIHRAGEGSWQSLNGSEYSLSWAPGQTPAEDGDTCASVNTDTVEGFMSDCSDPLPFVCQRMRVTGDET